MTNLTCVAVDAANLTEAQRDGLACIRCGVEADAMTPAGVAAGYGQVFQCSPVCADAETAQPTTTDCKPWCVRHEPDSEGGICHAADLAAPVEPGHETGQVRMAYDSQDGTLVHLHCKVDELTLPDAETIGRALLTQAATARRGERPVTALDECPAWCNPEYAHRHPMDVAHETGPCDLVSASLVDGDAFGDVCADIYQQPGKAAHLSLSIHTDQDEAAVELTPEEALRVGYGLINKAMAARAAGSR